MDFWVIPQCEEFTHEVRMGQFDGKTKISVVDFLGGLCNKKKGYAAQIWRRICKNHPEDVAHIAMEKFPGRRQRLTAVATEQELYRIGMLAPGARAKEYRKRASDLVYRAVRGDEGLIQELKARQAVLKGKRRPKQAYGLLRGPERQQSMSVVKQLQGALNQMCGGKDPNVYREVFRPNMVTIKGMEPHTIAEIYGISRGRVRDILTPEENITLGFLEMSQLRAVQTGIEENRRGKFAAVAICNQVRSNFTDHALSMMKTPVLPMKTYEVFVGLRVRTEGTGLTEEIPFQGKVIEETRDLQSALAAARVMSDLTKEIWMDPKQLDHKEGAAV